MMTTRVRWLILPAAVGLFLGMLRGQATLAMLSLSVLLWILVEWAMFCWRVWYQLPQLQLTRLVNGRGDPTGTLWCGRPVRIVLQVECQTGRLQPLMQIRDVLPENVEVLSRQPQPCANRTSQNAASDVRRMLDDSPGSPNTVPANTAAGTGTGTGTGKTAELQTGNHLTLTLPVSQISWAYDVRLRAAGRVMLPGVRVVLQDANGLFRVERFIDVRQEFRVLPAYAESDSPQPIIKRVNALAQHGIHRVQRSGMGSELLELREYVPGDPPKSIAWKVSARRDKLMTRQYESEVPVRVQLLVDGTLGTRVGGFGRRLLDQMTYVAASVARSAISVGDPVGAILFDERGQRRIAAGGGDRSFFNLLEALSEFSVPPSAPAIRLSNSLLNMATNVCGERFPELLDDRFNQVPFFFFPLSPWKRRIQHVRTMLAGAFAQIFALSPATQVRLIHDDGLMGVYMQHFLLLTGMSWMEPVTMPRERGFHDGMPRMQMLSEAIRAAVAHARDNEVLVICSDLLDCAPAISHLMPALKMAVGRHHRIAVVCPSPTFIRATSKTVSPRSDSAADLLLAAEQIRNRDLMQRLNIQLRRLGISVAMSGEANAIRMVLAETEIARSGRSSSARSAAAAGGRR